MIKEIKVEVPAVAAHIEKKDKYYCDSCNKEILYPGSLCTSTVSYCSLNDIDTSFQEQAENMYYYHLCSNCIKKYIVSYLDKIGFKAYKNKEMMSEEEYNNIIIRE